MSKKVTFPGGWWAELKTAWSYGSDMKIAAAWTFTDGEEKFERACLTTLQECITSAHLPDADGNAIAFGPEMWSRIDGRIGRKLLVESREAWSKWQEDSDPKDTKGSSDASPQG